MRVERDSVSQRMNRIGSSNSAAIQRMVVMGVTSSWAGRLLAASADALACWQAANPWSEGSCFEVVLALVALPVQRHCVRWIRIDVLDGVDWG